MLAARPRRSSPSVVVVCRPRRGEETGNKEGGGDGGEKERRKYQYETVFWYTGRGIGIGHETINFVTPVRVRQHRRVSTPFSECWLAPQVFGFVWARGGRNRGWMGVGRRRRRARRHPRAPDRAVVAQTRAGSPRHGTNRERRR